MTHIINLAIESPLKNAIITFRKIWTKCNEVALNINTLPDVPLDTLVDSGRPYLKGEYSEKAMYNDNVWYESPDYWYLYKIARLLGKNDLSNEVFCDIGSGKGRVLCVMARQNFKQVVGIELFEELCHTAAINANRMRGRKTPIDIICEDATRVALSEATVFFMFNPFGENTLRAVLENIKLAKITNQSNITIIYYNAVHEDVLESCGWLEEYYYFYTATGRKIGFWQNVSGETVPNELELAGAEQ